MIKYREFGKSGLKVSALGFGAGQLGDSALSDQDVNYLLAALQELGVNLVDTARGYGDSEARLGRLLPRRREDWVLSTKIGYGVADVEDWTTRCIQRGIDQALQRLQTDYLDIVHLHSCSLHILEQGDVIDALLESVRQGKVRVAAYSGENEALAWAIQSCHFGSVQCSVNLCDQYSLHQLLPTAQKQGLGVIAKRPLANAFWRFETQPFGDYSEVYWLRWQELAIQTDLPIHELALRFTLFAPGVHTGIIGTQQIAHLKENLNLVKKGPLPQKILAFVTERFKFCGESWRGEV